MSRPHLVKLLALLGAIATLRFVPAWWCGRQARAWMNGDARVQAALAEELIAFEARDDTHRQKRSKNRFAGEWALVTHQMTALGLAQVALAHPELLDRYRPIITRAAQKSFLPEMRDFGTEAWHGEDVLASLDGPHGHAYMAYPALAVGMARLLDPAFPQAIAQKHDALIAAFERRLLASPTGLIETYPHEAYPTDTAAVAGAIHAKETPASNAAPASSDLFFMTAPLFCTSARYPAPFSAYDQAAASQGVAVKDRGGAM